VPPERTGDHQKRAGCPQAVHLCDNGTRGRLAKHDLVHRAENNTPLVHALVLPGQSELGFQDSVAEQITDVMSEEHMAARRTISSSRES
jgi:hypothetical protein